LLKSLSNPRFWRRVRQGSQALFLALFIFLLFEAYQGQVAHPWTDVFFRFNPLSALSAMFAVREWIPRLGLSLITVGVTLVLGRVWCGWLCPMGTILEWIRFSKPNGQSTPLPSRLRSIKYLILAVIVAAALFGNLTLMILDPIAIMTRTMTTTVLPVVNYAVTSVETLLYPVRILRPMIDVIEQVLRGPILPVSQYFYAFNIVIALLFITIIGLNAISDRFWCRYFCPLGGLLALLSKVALFHRVVGEECNRCAMCAGTCPMDTIEPERGYQSDPGECTVCLDCLVSCPRSGIEFNWHWQPVWREYDPERRVMLTAMLSSAVGVALLNTSDRASVRDPYLVRPPGALDTNMTEDSFLSRCIRCGACIKVCPTGGLQLSGMEQLGMKGFWTPHLVPRLGQCDYGCRACGQVCPSGAIRPLSLPVKQSTVIGRAYIDTNRCLPWVDNISCAVCEEMCPVPDKAIILSTNVEIGGTDQAEVQVPRPYVLSELCIGCGLCEKRCPLNGTSAIRVYSPNEPPPPMGYA
jgi:MauM/NapG family ferredoxin protein